MNPCLIFIDHYLRFQLNKAYLATPPNETTGITNLALEWNGLEQQQALRFLTVFGSVPTFILTLSIFLYYQLCVFNFISPELLVYQS